MLAKITLYDGTIYRIADKTTDTQDGIYLGRIKDELSLVSAMQEAGNAPATINLTIINHDDFIPHSKDLWAAEVLLTNDNGVSWRGKINFCNFDADGNLYVTASEKTAPELELQLPDEVRQVYTVDEDFHQSSVTMTIPLVIGGTTSNPVLLPTILIDKTEGVYLICVGEIRSIVKVYNGTEELPNTAYTAYTGTSSQAEHAGFAYVKINEDYRLNADGSYAEINVEVVGLKLGDFTEEECRNGALFLYYFLTTAATGINGWGCGIDQSEIDTASFQSAITLCNQLGYKLDGIMWLRQSAQSWIDQICQAIHGKYSINANGKRSLFIDYAGNASKKTFTASNMQVDKYGKNSYTSVVYNKGILSYDYNPITGLFMQSAQYENAESIAQIGEQKFVGESYLLKDPTTALAVLEYTCKRSQTAAEAIEFKTDDIDTVLRAGDVITINRPDLSINNALYQIQNISITDYEASISAVKFDTSVFIVSGTPSSVNWGNERDITPALTPAMATSLYLSTGFDINPDGTGTPYISGTFTVPEGGWLAAAVQYGISASPSNWTELALITDGRFKISPVNVGTVYSVRIRMITATGHSDYLRGQITATGDTTPPAEPTIAVKATDKTVTVQCGLDNPPYDMGGFQIYRKKSTEQVYTYIGSIAANRGYASFSDYVDEYVTYNYQAKSYDRSGNLSTNFSNVASVTVTGIQANDVAATALAMPTGSILRLSAKNCHGAEDNTTPQTYANHISDVNGVKDVSGNGNHGRAYGDVEVVKDAEMGDCFSFVGINGYVYLPQVQYSDKFSFHVKFKLNSLPSSNYMMIFDRRMSTSAQSGYLLITAAGQLIYGMNNATYGVCELTSNARITANQIVTVTITLSNGYGAMYVGGAKDVDTTDCTVASISQRPIRLGASIANTQYLDGIISDFRIYPRALSASEVKTIFMFPDDVTFGQMTADLIGANIIKAENLIKTDKVISTAAQIDQAVFQSLIVTNGSTVANQVDVGGRNLAKSTSETEIVMNSDGTSAIGNRKIYALSLSLTQGKQYTVSLFAKGSNTTDVFYVSLVLGTVTKQMIANEIKLTTSYQKLEFTFSKDSNSVNGLIITNFKNYGGQSANTGTLYFKDVKLEEGNKATTWTPAPEDTDASINAITDNIYTPNTTTINGGKITTNSITATQLSTDAIKSRNFTDTNADILVGKKFATQGSFFNLAAGTLTAPKFRFGSDGSCQMGAFKVQADGSLKSTFGNNGYVFLQENRGLRIYDPDHYSDAEFFPYSSYWAYNAPGGQYSGSQTVYITPSASGSSYSDALVDIRPYATSMYGLYVKGKARFNTSDYGSDEKTKKDFQDVSTLDKLKKLRVCAWRFDEEKLVEKDNAFIDAENIKIEAENKAIDAENAEIEKENKLRKNRKDGEKVELIPLKEHKKLREHRIADKNANHPLNIGCMAGEFNKAFGTNDGSEDCLSVTDVVGVCMRAIQELAEISDAQKAEIAELKALLKNQGALPDSGISLPDYDEKTDAEPVSDSGKPLPEDEKSDVEQENQQEEQK